MNKKPDILRAHRAQAKRALDVALAILAILVFAPVMLGVAILIKIVSPGPILFRQTRVGYLGRQFERLQFRTMRPNVTVQTVRRAYLVGLMAQEKPMTKVESMGDPSVIPFGHFLRAISIDELPQLFNILRGEMSIVGPRPCTIREYNLYTTSHKRRLCAKPGITGLWQVSGKNGGTFSDMIHLDIRYCESWDVRMDLRIILRTWRQILIQLWQYSFGVGRSAMSRSD